MLIDGTLIAQNIQQEIQTALVNLPDRVPTLAVILVGEHPASEIYVRRKSEACRQVGIQSLIKKLPATISELELIKEITKLNLDPSIDGILVQLPLPPSIHPLHVTHAISPDKDVDGFHPYNIGKLLNGEKDGFVPCTPLGIKTLIERSHGEITGQHALIIGRSNIVGKPMAALLMQAATGANATVTVANSHTKNLKEIALMADIIIVAIGQAYFLKEEMVKEGAIVIDVGINKIPCQENKKGYAIVGDVDFDRVAPKCALITPVPGGVGPMTIAMLLQNTWLSYKRRLKK